jgi:hypothetical protein
MFNHERRQQDFMKHMALILIPKVEQESLETWVSHGICMAFAWPVGPGDSNLHKSIHPDPKETVRQTLSLYISSVAGQLFFPVSFQAGASKEES